MTGQNRSSAVMQQRAIAPDSLDYFPTPPWATRALCEFLRDDLGEDLAQQSCWEPACGELHMAKPLAEYFGRVRASDVHRYCAGHDVADFLLEGAAGGPFEWVVTNPPFVLAERFIHRAIALATRGCAMLVRGAFTESERRWPLFRDTPPAFVLTFVERVAMFSERLIRVNAPDPFNLFDDGEPRRASSATSYAWLIWRDGDRDTRHRWIGPARERLEREGDYPAYEEQWAKLRAYQAELAAARGEERLI